MNNPFVIFNTVTVIPSVTGFALVMVLIMLVMALLITALLRKHRHSNTKWLYYDESDFPEKVSINLESLCDAD